jgi:hypothetical protein
VSFESQDSEFTHYLDKVSSRLRKVAERTKYRRSLEGISLIENYRRGKLSIVLDFVIPGERNPVGSSILDSDCVGVPGSFVSLLIFQDDSRSVENLHHWQEQPMLVRNVEVVKTGDDAIPIISTVRLYLGHNPLKEGGTKNVYFSPLESVFYKFSGFSDGKLSMFIKGGSGTPFDDSQIAIFDSGAQVMYGVSDDHSQIRSQHLSVWRKVADYLQTGFFVTLSRGMVGVWQPKNNLLDIRNVFIGPFEFKSSSGESVDHKSDSIELRVG